MKQSIILEMTLLQLRELYREEFPELINIALQNKNIVKFKARLYDLINKCPFENKTISKQLFLLIDFDGANITELSTGEVLHISTLSMLHNFLLGQWNEDIGLDLFIDLFYQFKRLKQQTFTLPTEEKIKVLTERWYSGLDQVVQDIRIRNKERIIHSLIQKISKRSKQHSLSRYCFTPELSYEEKFSLVYLWWDDFQFQLAMAIRTPDELNSLLGSTLSDEYMFLLSEAEKKGIPFFVTPYYLSLLNVSGSGYDDKALRSYILYSSSLVQTFGEIHAWEKEDVIEDGRPNAAGWLLPDGHNIHRRYPDVAILIPDTMGRACGGLCASCQRMYNFQSKRLNFELDKLKPNENWEIKLNRLMSYFEYDTQLRDILITGGDALMSQNKTLRKILDAVYQMALRKQEANKSRPEGEKYAEIRRIRLGSRLPAYLPMRTDDALISILKEFKQKASKIGIRQFIIQTHFQTPLEVTPEAADSVRKLQSAGWIVSNQLVYNVAASRRGHTIRLRQILNKIGVVCYYTFTVKGFEENQAVFAPNSRSVQEQCEEKCFGDISTEKAYQLTSMLNNCTDPASCMAKFMKVHKLSFLSTDRNVLNLPAIGKSMTFDMVGMTIDGKRILRFDHDHTRQHSPIISKMGKIFIVESKSIAAYLRQLKMMGENVEDYATIWNYTEGKTEPRFHFFEYPQFSFEITKKMTNFKSE